MYFWSHTIAWWSQISGCLAWLGWQPNLSGQVFWWFHKDGFHIWLPKSFVRLPLNKTRQTHHSSPWQQTCTPSGKLLTVNSASQAHFAGVFLLFLSYLFSSSAVNVVCWLSDQYMCKSQAGNGKCMHNTCKGSGPVIIFLPGRAGGGGCGGSRRVLSAFPPSWGSVIFVLRQSLFYSPSLVLCWRLKRSLFPRKLCDPSKLLPHPPLGRK